MTEADLDRANLVSHDMLLDRAVRLFEFLRRAQQLRNQPARDVETYRRDGVVLWLKDLPHHPALHSALNQGEPAVNDTLLSVERVSRVDPPKPDDQLRECLPLRTLALTKLIAVRFSLRHGYL